MSSYSVLVKPLRELSTLLFIVQPLYSITNLLHFHQFLTTFKFEPFH
ncbi:hypothetical protein AOR13_3977 [Alteromonas stellipolaris LMG 21856]|nr:hypothetical protein AOR13_3977 [Alteromonas stellipolaris LMG 21856]